MTDDALLDDALLGAVARAIVPAATHPGAIVAEALTRDHPEWAPDFARVLSDLDRRTGGFAAASDAARTAALDSLTADAGFRRLARLVAHGHLARPSSWESVGWRPYPLDFTPSGDVPAEVRDSIVPRGAVASNYDAIVIGSGAGGGVAARALTEAGLQVLVVERGSAPPTADLASDHLRNPRSDSGLEVLTGPPIASNSRVALNAQAATVDATDPRWNNNAMTLGGGTRVYGAQAWRFTPQDFAMASTYGVPDGSALADWPVTYDDMEPYYTRAEYELGVSGAPGSAHTEGPRSRPFPMPPLPMTRPAELLRDGAARLGWATLPPPLLINSVERAGRAACVACAQCPGFACPVSAKSGSQNTTLAGAAATGRLSIVIDTQATELVTDGDGRVVGVRLCAAGAEAGTDSPWETVVRADQVVLAAGAIESARLLLASRSAREPSGIGNGHDQVGRHLQGHVYGGALGIFDEDVNDFVGPGPAIATNDFRHGNEGIVGGGMLANEFVPTPASTLSYLQDAGLASWHGEEMMSDLARLSPRMQRVVGPVHELTVASSRVTLDPSVKDALGMPVARLSGGVHALDISTQRFLNDRAGEWLRASGATTVVPWEPRPANAGPSGGQHQAGTARMGTDPSRSATDPHGRVWGHDNLRVIDGSTHVTNGGVNPVLTILANAMRIADDLVRELSQ
ncbi:GMC family oxidoreductase [Demequina oxidasica]|uniref:GMC family oxidoreductase n=1 Tax=Demequina oxidasica TaxID=676199 RepID=UPI0007866FCD|nr:GMC family oxidoreductase [Demequina oxidasica]